MSQRTRILFLSANPWTTSRILVDEEAREIFEKLQEGSSRDKFELQNHAATRAIDLQRLLMKYKPHVVHFSAHGSKRHKIILGGSRGRGKEVDPTGLVELFALYRRHVKLVFLNACFTKAQAQSLCEVIDYTIGTGKMIGDKSGVAFAGAFYRALSFNKSVPEAFQSAKVELALTKMPRSNGLELFVREGLNRNSFPKARTGKRRKLPRAATSTRSLSSRVHSHIPERRRAHSPNRDLICSPMSGLLCGSLHTSCADARRYHDEGYEDVRYVRMRPLANVRCSSGSMLTRSRSRLKTAPNRHSVSRRRLQLSEKNLSPMGFSVASAPELVSMVRIVMTERIDLLVNNASKD